MRVVYDFISFQGLLRQSLSGERAVPWQHGPFYLHRAIGCLARNRSSPPVTV